MKPADEQKESASSGYAFGAFKGVFTPSILTILGVIMYLRFGWVLGQVGLAQTLLIVTMATAITFLTSLSLSATATNMHVGGGGAYFIISRALGIEVGAAIGVPLFLAQSVGVAFYITGFAEALSASVDVSDWVAVLPFAITEIRLIAVLTLTALTVLAIVSADLALKTQFLILLLIVASLASFFFGGPVERTLPEAVVDLTGRVPFWVVFAVFFPAVTGIEAGLAMSGDLKEPDKALPRGTLAAVGVGYLVYMAIPIVLILHVPDREVLIADPMIMRSVARWGGLILLGVWAATLSSALGALLGAPRTLQALSRDRITPGCIGRGFGKKNDPRIATTLTFGVALVAILLGDLNLIAPVLSMFFLTSYGLINLSAGLEGLIDSPSWRPRFRVHPFWCLLGGIACFATMFMINAGATFIALVLIGVIYAVVKRRNLQAQWGDMRYGILMLISRFAIRKLARRQADERTWRPNILVLSGAPQSRWYLIEMAHALVRSASGMTVAALVSGDQWVTERIRALRHSIEDYLEKRGIDSLVKVMRDDNFYKGAEALVRAYGYGPIRPNTVLMGDSADEKGIDQYAKLVMAVYRMDRNLVLVRETEQAERPKLIEEPFIDIWWSGQQANIGLMLTLAHLLKRHENWSESRLRLRRIISKDMDPEEIEASLSEHVVAQRLDVQVDLITPPAGESPFELIRSSSHESALVFLGLRAPEPEETAEAYAAYYRHLHAETADLPVAYVLAANRVDFEQIIGLG